MALCQVPDSLEEMVSSTTVSPACFACSKARANTSGAGWLVVGSTSDSTSFS